MSDPRWARVDGFAARALLKPDPALEAARKASEAAGLPAISVSPLQGAFLHVLARATKPRAILEIGTLGGYSTIWLARALEPGGRLITLEYERKHADVARKNVDRAGVGDRVEIKVGKAIDALPSLTGPFDCVFIDADKPTTTEYFQWAVKLARSGSLIVVDNVVRDGAIAENKRKDEDVAGMRRFLETAGRDSRVAVSVIQTVGDKGYDGFALAVVL
ncbi:MAG TPA: O-methyltransferase [Vicinamibacterales bacterium]